MVNSADDWPAWVKVTIVSLIRPLPVPDPEHVTAPRQVDLTDMVFEAD